MPLDLFNAIEKAESDAKAQLASAQKEARDILKACEEACSHDIKAQEKQLKEKYQEEINKRKATIQLMLDNKMSEKEKENAQLLKQAESSITSAASYIAKKVLQNGNS
ncbi:MAG: hypothetical protein Q4E07_05605 [Eubacteriales bacterium]|nr:hypothetical protein [Eubacteriales bacterium]